MRNAKSNYAAHFLIAMFFYALVLILSIWLIRSFPGAAWHVPVALSPAIPGFVAALVIAREIGSRDELQRQIQLEAIAFAFGGTAIVAVSIGLLEIAGARPLNGAYFIPIMMALWGIGQFWAIRRYR